MDLKEVFKEFRVPTDASAVVRGYGPTLTEEQKHALVKAIADLHEAMQNEPPQPAEQNNPSVL
jgi:translation elongation factor EF-Tu-like GTPase